MNDPQEKNTQNPYHIYYDNYLDTNACTECTGLRFCAGTGISGPYR